MVEPQDTVSDWVAMENIVEEPSVNLLLAQG
jgi:hypothetical protein